MKIFIIVKSYIFTWISDLLLMEGNISSRQQSHCAFNTIRLVNSPTKTRHGTFRLHQISSIISRNILSCRINGSWYRIFIASRGCKTRSRASLCIACCKKLKFSEEENLEAFFDMSSCHVDSSAFKPENALFQFSKGYAPRIYHHLQTRINNRSLSTPD